MPGKFELKKSGNGQFFFNLKAGNGQVILSSEQYGEKRGAEGGIASVQKNAPDDGRYERKESSNGQKYFVLKAGNGQAIGRSEMYTTAASMENGIESVKKNAPGATTSDLTA
jgi:uncharacterized protein YegP (UPF0339 family)